MDNILNKQADFQRTFGRPVRYYPTLITQEDAVFRQHLISEELNEYLEAAVLQKDLVAVGDALGDLLYVVLGTIHEHGFGNIIEGIFDEIHRSNMSKLWDDGNGNMVIKNDKNGKTMKPSTYSPPDVASIIAKALPNEE